MEWDVVAFAGAPIMMLIGYLHMRLSTAEEEIERMITREEAKDLVAEKLEVIRLQQDLFKERLNKLEESLDRLGDKIDKLLSRA